PEFSGSPDSGCVGANDGSANRAKRTIHVGMGVGGYNEGAGYDVTALHHYLVADARSRGIKVDPMLFGESLNSAVFLLVGFVLVLNVVVEREYQLFGIMNFFRADSLEFAHHSGSVVVGHHVKWADGNEIAGPQRTFRSFGQVRARDFFNDGFAHSDSAFAYLFFLVFTFFAGAATAAFFSRISAFISVMRLDTDSSFSNAQIASLSFFCAPPVRTPSASAANFSSIS